MESDVVTLEDVFLAKPPEEDSPTAGRTLALLSPTRLHGPQAPLPREDGRFGRRSPADVLQAGGLRPGTPAFAAGYGR